MQTSFALCTTYPDAVTNRMYVDAVDCQCRSSFDPVSSVWLHFVSVFANWEKQAIYKNYDAII